MGAPDRRAHRVQTAVVFPSCVVYERSSIESEGGNPVAETLDGTGGRGVNSLAELLEFPSSIGRQRRKVGSHLQSGPLCVIPRRRGRCHSHPPSGLPRLALEVISLGPLMPIDLCWCLTLALRRLRSEAEQVACSDLLCGTTVCQCCFSSRPLGDI